MHYFSASSCSWFVPLWFVDIESFLSVLSELFYSSVSPTSSTNTISRQTTCYSSGSSSSSYSRKPSNGSPFISSLPSKLSSQGQGVRRRKRRELSWMIRMIRVIRMKLCWVKSDISYFNRSNITNRVFIYCPLWTAYTFSQCIINILVGILWKWNGVLWLGSLSSV